MKNNILYKLPDRSTTEDVDLYADSWIALARPIEEVFGWRATSFNPGITFDTGRHNGTLLNLTVTECIAIADRMQAYNAVLVLLEEMKEDAKSIDSRESTKE